MLDMVQGNRIIKEVEDVGNTARVGQNVYAPLNRVLSGLPSCSRIGEHKQSRARRMVSLARILKLSQALCLGIMSTRYRGGF